MQFLYSLLTLTCLKRITFSSLGRVNPYLHFDSAKIILHLYLLNNSLIVKKKKNYIKQVD